MTEQVLTPPLDPITAPVRSNAVDIVKGLAILLVTYEHTGQGMASRGWWTTPSRDFSYLYVYSFHMPAFFVLAGLFVAGSIHRRGPKDFVLEKMKSILYVYLLWAVLLSATDPLINRFKQHPHTVHWQSFPISLINGVAGWFFPVLFLCLMLALITSKLPAWLRFGLAFIVSSFMTAYGYEVFYKTAWYFCFLAGGMLVGRSIFKLSALPRWASAISAILVFALQAAVLHHYAPIPNVGGPPQWLVVVLGFSGTAGLFLIARTLQNTPVGNAWAWIGSASLGIFLIAQFVQGAARDLLTRVAHTNEFWLQLIIPTLLSTLVPAVLWHQQKRWHIGWLFRWPLS